MLEAGLNADNSFITLTYESDPVSLEPKDLTAFVKALRKRIAPIKIRFYAVGEYGEKNQRPHYHVALFGWPHCRRVQRRGNCTCRSCKPILQSWGRGFIVNLPLEIGSARYIARYTTKKMTRTDDPRLGNRHPEFARMSLNPGIGAGVIEMVADTIRRYNLFTPEGDVPFTLRHGTTLMPLGRYLRRKLRKHLGLDVRVPHLLSPEASFRHFHSEENLTMRTLQEAALTDKEAPTLKQQILKHSKAARDQIAARYKLFNRNKGEL